MNIQNTSRRLVVAIVLLFMLTSSALRAQEHTKRSVIANGATSISTPDITLQATLGQPIIGTLQRTQHIYQGFWYGTNSQKQSSAVVSELPFDGSSNDILLNAIPNPVANRADITLFLPQTGDVSLRLYDNLGRELRTLLKGKQRSGTLTLRLDVTDLSTGSYTIACSLGTLRKTLPIMVTK